MQRRVKSEISDVQMKIVLFHDRSNQLKGCDEGERETDARPPPHHPPIPFPLLLSFHLSFCPYLASFSSSQFNISPYLFLSLTLSLSHSLSSSPTSIDPIEHATWIAIFPFIVYRSTMEAPCPIILSKTARICNGCEWREKRAEERE